MNPAESASSVPSRPGLGHARPNSPKLVQWVQEIAVLTNPDRIFWCDGSPAEYDAMCDLLVANGTAVRLNPARRAGCILVRSDPTDVARVEDRTFICSVR